MILVIRVRGRVGVSKEVRDTLDMLNLKRNNWATIIPEFGSYLGMLKKVKDYVAYGKINKDFLKELIKKRGEGKKELKEEDYVKLEKGELRLKDVGLKPYFRLHPPRKGFGNKKLSFKLGGVLGKWDDITKLARRML